MFIYKIVRPASSIERALQEVAGSVLGRDVISPWQLISDICHLIKKITWDK